MDYLYCFLGGFVIGAVLMYIYHSKVTAQLNREHAQAMDTVMAASAAISTVKSAASGFASSVKKL